MVKVWLEAIDIEEEVLKEIEDLEEFPLTECQQDIINFCKKHVKDIIEEEGII